MLAVRPLGTILSAGEGGISKASVRNYCYENNGVVCCDFQGSGAPCTPGTGPVSTDYKWVSLRFSEQPGMWELIAGPNEGGEMEAISAPFPIPGHGVTEPAPPPPSRPTPAPAKPPPTAPGPRPPTKVSPIPAWFAPTMVGLGVAAAAYLIAKPRKAG